MENSSCRYFQFNSTTWKDTVVTLDMNEKGCASAGCLSFLLCVFVFEVGKVVLIAPVPLKLHHGNFPDLLQQFSFPKSPEVE